MCRQRRRGYPGDTEKQWIEWLLEHIMVTAGRSHDVKVWGMSSNILPTEFGLCQVEDKGGFEILWGFDELYGFL